MQLARHDEQSVRFQAVNYLSNGESNDEKQPLSSPIKRNQSSTGDPHGSAETRADFYQFNSLK